jgi:hypothetical protein
MFPYRLRCRRRRHRAKMRNRVHVAAIPPMVPPMIKSSRTPVPLLPPCSESGVVDVGREPGFVVAPDTPGGSRREWLSANPEDPTCGWLGRGGELVLEGLGRVVGPSDVRLPSVLGSGPDRVEEGAGGEAAGAFGVGSMAAALVVGLGPGLAKVLSGGLVPVSSI